MQMGNSMLQSLYGLTHVHTFEGRGCGSTSSTVLVMRAMKMLPRLSH